MSIIQGNAHPEEGYNISRSLRFNSADSAYLNRTFGSVGTRTIWTYNVWLKRGSFGSLQRFLSDSTNNSYFRFTTGDVLEFNFNTGSTSYTILSSQVFRDPSAWYMITVAVDTTQATASNRVKIYVNGAQVTAFSSASYPVQNATSNFNNNTAHYISGYSATAEYFNGYLTEVNFIDGQALTPSAFGETNPITGVWQPKKYTGTYGTNGFYLNFSDNSGTTATTLGKDYSGNGNNWTPNNFSITAGAGNDSLVDVPTRYGTDTGAGGEVRGNYATLNPLSLFSPATLSNGNLDVNTGTTAYGFAYGTIAIPTSGKWYWEYTPTSNGNQALCGISIYRSGAPTNSLGYYAGSGEKYVNNVNSAYGATYTNNDVIGVAVDVDAGTVTFYKNNSSQGSISYATSSGLYFPWFADGTGATGTAISVNFGARPFAYTAPSGFKALCTTNLPEPSIKQGDDYFNVVLYTGTGSSRSVTGVGFQPDFVWIKERNGAADHALYDVVRGVQKQLETNSPGTETTETTGLTAFGSDGFTVGSLAQVNTNTDTYVAWNWKAGGTGVTNTAGTITSTVSANTTAGFSVVTATLSGANGTIGHGLGVAPKLIIGKRRNSTSDWPVYHNSIGAGNVIYLNTTAASAASSTTWNSTTPTSTVFSVGTGLTGDWVFYVFSEVPGYSRFGSYVGTGNSDGPMIWCGFRPRYVLLKRTAVAGNGWIIHDTSVAPENVVNKWLQAQDAGGEATADEIDILSNGFKIRTASNRSNVNGELYIFAAFAEFPFQTALAR